MEVDIALLLFHGGLGLLVESELNVSGSRCCCFESAFPESRCALHCHRFPLGQGCSIFFKTETKPGKNVLKNWARACLELD